MARRAPTTFLWVILVVLAASAGGGDTTAPSADATIETPVTAAQSEPAEEQSSTTAPTVVDAAAPRITATSADSGPVATIAPVTPAEGIEPRTTDTSSATKVPDQPALEIAQSALPLTQYDVPSEFGVEHVAVGDEYTVFAGFSSGIGAFLARSDRLASAKPVVEILGIDGDVGSPTISSIVWFRGRFFAFTMWDTTSRPTSPTVLTSVDGLSWTVGRMAVIAEAGLFRTPDSPSDSEHAGVVDAAVITSGGEQTGIVATGWALHRDEASAMLWESTSGEIWKATPLPNQGFAGEVGTYVASSSAGQLVRLGGPIHMGVGAVVRHRAGDAWEEVAVADEGFIAGVAANDLYLYVLEGSVNHGPRQILWREAEGESWAAQQLPASLADNRWNLTLEASSWHDPVVVERSGPRGVVMWTLDRQRWIATQIEGEYLISVTAAFVATRTKEKVLVYDRRFD